MCEYGFEYQQKTYERGSAGETGALRVMSLI